MAEASRKLLQGKDLPVVRGLAVCVLDPNHHVWPPPGSPLCSPPLWPQPGRTAVAVLSLALAIGPNSMLFSVVDRMFLRTTVEGIENVYFVYLKTTQAGVYQNPTYADFPQYQSALTALPTASLHRVMVRFSVEALALPRPSARALFPEPFHRFGQAAPRSAVPLSNPD